jgi:lipopolysaccharide transport system permease protein/teichoic acid transport system permease protein
MIRAMAVREIQSRYIGTLGGLVWAMINPLMFILVYWFIFSVGFRVQPAGGVPFIVVFLCGLIPWSMFAEALTTSTGAISANPHLVTKTVFPTEILPIVNITASLITHSIMLGIFIVILLFNNISLSFYNLQFLYYLSGLLIFSLGLSWISSAINVFYKDVGQALGIVLNLWFWFTPIVWSQDMIPSKYQFILKLNPMYYIVDGYKSSFIYHSVIGHNMLTGICFWVVCMAVFITGACTFKKLKSEFAEVL